MKKFLACSLLLCGGWLAMPAVAAQKQRTPPLAQRAAAAPVAQEQVGERYALVIGNAAYRNVPVLRNPANDSRDMCAALKQLQFHTVCLENLKTRGQIRDAIAEFVAKIKPADVALFYFAGHGVEANGENYLIPTEAQIKRPQDLEDDALRVGLVFDYLRSVEARLSIVMLDACRNNPFQSIRAINRGGLAIPVNTPKGSILIYPTAPGKTALDGDGRNGLFTTHLLKHIKTPGISIEEMFKRVINGVGDDAHRMGEEQVPWLNLSFTGEFCFVGCGTRVSAEELQQMVDEKRDIESKTMQLRGELDKRQAELDAFKLRMGELQKQMDAQKSSQTLSQTELERLSRERAGLLERIAQVQAQGQELLRVKQELDQRQREAAARAQEVALANQRIKALETQLTLASQAPNNTADVKRLEEERDRMVRQQADQLAGARKDLQGLQSKLAEFDGQRRELDQYKVRMAQLEEENRRKDASFQQLMAELDKRQNELKDVQVRVVTLQQQLDTSKGKQLAVSQEELARLAQDRRELARQAQLLKVREDDLQQARLQLAQLERSNAQAVQREAEMAGHRERIAQLETALAQRTGASTQDAQQLDSLKQERAELLRMNAALQRQQAAPSATAQEVATLRQRLADYDRQQAELDNYKQGLALLEKKLKNAKTEAVKDATFVPPAM